ncbi:MAG: 4-(cytidine 5'-diphospho)-2-C-methyl-D-erythritol kinase [Balneolales bacterium]|nr:4-(cytidine 5'-diphospho)-2-C-methyl-D-erythritol kinase [Balneolales bacterium]
MSEWFIADSYAKINLGLFVKERLPNGYHDIETGFAFIRLSDTIEVQRSDATRINCNDPDVPTGKDNLIVKAIRAFHARYNTTGFFEIRLNKQIPAGAGLGGGSSNAAVMLRLLNRIYNMNIPLKDLCELGAGLGADVPVFIRAQTAIGSGTGTELTFADIQPDYFIVSAWPGIHSSTQEAYMSCEPMGPPEESLLDILTEYNPDEWNYLLRNDLEPPVIRKYPQVGNLKDQFMDMGALYASMSGSGSAVYGIFEHEITARQAYDYLVQLKYSCSFTPPGFTPQHNVYLKG